MNISWKFEIEIGKNNEDTDIRSEVYPFVTDA